MIKTRKRLAIGSFSQMPGIMFLTAWWVPSSMRCDDRSISGYSVPRQGDPTGNDRYYTGGSSSRCLVGYGPLSKHFATLKDRHWTVLGDSKESVLCNNHGHNYCFEKYHVIG